MLLHSLVFYLLYGINKVVKGIIYQMKLSWLIQKINTTYCWYKKVCVSGN